MKIDPKHVEELYKKFNYKARIGAFGLKQDKSCCALGVLYMEECGELPQNSQIIYDWAANKYGYEYSVGFYEGFDGYGRSSLNDCGEIGLGHKNGQLVRRHLGI